MSDRTDWYNFAVNLGQEETDRAHSAGIRRSDITDEEHNLRLATIEAYLLQQGGNPSQPFQPAVKPSKPELKPEPVEPGFHFAKENPDLGYSLAKWILALLAMGLAFVVMVVTATVTDGLVVIILPVLVGFITYFSLKLVLRFGLK